MARINWVSTDTDGLDYAADLGHDVIRDLHTTGPQMDNLIIKQDIESIKRAHGGRDTRLELSDGSTI